MDVFKGFFPETVAFFESLFKNNTRKWFETHKPDYEKYVKNPSIEFVSAMGEKLRKICSRHPGDPQSKSKSFQD